MVADAHGYDDLAGYARDSPVILTLVEKMSGDELLARLHVTARDFEPLPPPGDVDWDFNAGRIVGLLRDDPSGWTVVAEFGSRFDGIELVEAAPPGLRALCVGFFHHGLFLFADDGRLRRQFELTVYDPSDALPEEQDLPFGELGRGIPASMALVERLTAVQPEQAWFSGPFPYVWAPNS